MKRLKEIYKFRRKLMTVNILFVIAAVIIVGAASYAQYSKHITGVIMNSERMMFNQTNERLNEYLDNTNRLSRTFFLNDAANTLFREDMDFQDPEVFYSIQSLFSAYLQSEPSIVGLYIMSLESGLIAGDGYRNLSPEIEDALLDAAKDSVGRSLAFVSTMAEDSDVFYAVRMIKSVEDFHDIAVGIVVLDKQILSDMMANMEITENTVNFIIDKNNALVRGENLPPGAEIIDFDSISESEHEILSIGGRRYFISCGSLEAAEWKVYTLIPMSDINSQINVLLIALMLTLTLIILVVSIVIFFINYNITHPLAQLINAFDKVSCGDLKYRAEVSGDDEIKNVIVRFNAMMDEVEKLTRTIYTTQRDLYEAELEKKQSELRLLQSQIKSHFLYNALGTLRGMGCAGNWELMSICIDNIADMLRYASRVDEKVRLKEEIKYISNYQNIQSARYQGKNIIKYELDPDTLEVWIAKLMLQPIIENSIEHGRKKGRRLVIKISSFIENGMCILRIVDNGKGMSEEKQNELNQRINNIENDYNPKIGSGMGLWNVQKRIKFLFGEEYGIALKSYEGRGTIITICVPYEVD